MSISSPSRIVGSAVAWLAATAGIAVAIATAASPGGFALPGVSPDHVAALVALLLMPLAFGAVGPAVRRIASGPGTAAHFARHCTGLPRATRAAAALLLVGATVHLALLPAHLAMEPQTGILFAFDVAAFLGALALTLTVAHWRVPAGAVALLTVVAYACYLRTGRENADLVGVLTSAAEIAVIPIALVDWVRLNWGLPGRRVAAVAVAVVVSLISTTTVARAVEGRSSLANAMAALMPGSDTGSSMSGGAASSTSTANGSEGGQSMANGNMSTGGVGAVTPGGATMAGSVCPNVAAMPMADGMLMQPVPSAPPTPAQVAATNQLVAQTTAGIARYADVSAAIAAGYTPTTRTNLPVVHMLNRANISADPLADPSAPQTLVYAHQGSRWVLLGAMFMTNAQCKEGPDIGGSLTDWHAHVNLCFTSAGTVSGSHPNASGQCPAGQTTHATPFMLHVYTVRNNPSGPFELSNSAIAAALRG